jgi:hypothetical protein
MEPQTGDVDSPSLDKDAWLPSGLPGVAVAGARGGLRSGYRLFFCFLGY